MHCGEPEQLHTAAKQGAQHDLTRTVTPILHSCPYPDPYRIVFRVLVRILLHALNLLLMLALMLELFLSIL